MLGYVGINFGSGMYEEKRKGDFSMDREEKEEGKKTGGYVFMGFTILVFFYFF